MGSRPLVLAHRGACRREPENTLAAFVRARDLGADGVELDVRRSADDVLIVHHDASVGPVGVLRTRPFAEIRAALPEVPTLDEAFDACSGWFVNVEIKCLPWEVDADPDRVVVRGVVDLVRAHRVDVVVSSFDLGTIDAVREYAPELPTGFLVHHSDLRASAAVARAHGHDWLHPDRVSMLAAPADGLAHARAENLRVDVWTVDDPDEMQLLAAAGVDAIITNVPDVARRTLG